MTDSDMMREAIREAKIALSAGEMPVGCVIALDGKIIARGHNLRQTTNDPTAHAEIVAIRRASDALGSWRLSGAELFVTLEPCPMCAGAIVMARIARLVFGARDAERGCAGSVYRIPEDPAFNHFCLSCGPLLADECRAPLDRFFRAHRG